MQLFNATKNIIIADGVRELRSEFEKARGLLGEGEPHAVYFKTRFGIHTFGMKFPIDCVILDNNFVVRGFRRALKPNSFFFWNPRWYHVIELPEGTLSRTNTEKGDVLALQESA